MARPDYRPPVSASSSAHTRGSAVRGIRGSFVFLRRRLANGRFAAPNLKCGEIHIADTPSSFGKPGDGPVIRWSYVRGAGLAGARVRLIVNGVGADASFRPRGGRHVVHRLDATTARPAIS